MKHKETISSLRSTLDVLTLSATPIPRTLHMALAGFRDASLIATPPPGRRPIDTELVPYSADAVKNSIIRELDRDGQVFYVVPRIQLMEKKMAQLKALVPGARIKACARACLCGSFDPERNTHISRTAQASRRISPAARFTHTLLLHVPLRSWRTAR